MCENLAYFALHFLKAQSQFFVPCHNLNLMKKNSSFFYIILFFFAIYLSSCTPAKNVVYFKNVPAELEMQTLLDQNWELRIRKNDLLSITIISPDPLTTPLFNASQSSSSGNDAGRSGNNSTSGYLVDQDGKIVIYKLGSIHVEGLTRKQLTQVLQRELAPYLKDAVVTIRFLNNKVTILGEVAKPQIITIPNEKISILDAIAESGDLTISGRRDNILVIRETPTGKQFKRINISDNSIFNSPFYYLKPDDVVYVEPTEFKLKTLSQNQQVIGYVLTGVSILITIISLLLR